MMWISRRERADGIMIRGFSTAFGWDDADTASTAVSQESAARSV